MRPTNAWIFVLTSALALVGCGRGSGGATESPPAAEQAVAVMLDALAEGDAGPLVDAQDLREHFAALPASQRDATTFEAFAKTFRTASLRAAVDGYLPGESTHQVMGHYDYAGSTMVTVRFRRDASASWRTWDLPFRFIDGTWRMGLGGLETMFGKASVAPADSPMPQPDPASIPAPLTEDPATKAEQEALARLRRFLADGGDVNARIEEGSLLDWPASGHRRLHIAAERGWVRVATLLLEHGADAKAVAMSKSHYNRLTPVDVARHAGHPEVVTLIERELEKSGEDVRELELVFPEPGRAGALVSFDRGRIRLVTQDMEGQEVEDDLFIEPSDPDIQAITRDFDGLRHVGKDVAVSLRSNAFDAIRYAPSIPPDWMRALPRASIEVGSVFLVRSGSGKLYKVEIGQCDTTAVKLRYAALRPRGR